MLLLLTFSCTEAIWYPHAPAVDSGAVTTPIDTADTAGALPCSPSSATPAASLQITNSGVAPAVQVLWRDSACAEIAYHTLLPGDSISQPSFEGHVWVARDVDGAALDYIATPAGSAAWEITQ